MSNIIRAAITLDDREYQRGIQRARSQTQDLERDVANLGKAFRVGVAAMAGFATGAAALARSQIRLGSQLTDTADKLGLNVEYLQELRYAGNQANISTQTVDMAMQRFTRRLAEAARGTGEARDALREMGVSLRGSDGQLRSTQDILADVSDALANTTDESERVRLAFRLFDSEGVSFINVLRGGSEALREQRSEARSLGGVLTELESRTLKRTDDEFGRFSQTISGLAQQFTLGLAPALGTAVRDLTSLSALNQQLARDFGAGVGEALRTLASAARVVSENIHLITASVQAFIGIRIMAFLSGLLAQMRKNTSGAKFLSGIFSGMGEAIRSIPKRIPILAGALRVITAMTPAGAAATAMISGLGVALGANRDKLVDLQGVTTTWGEIVQAVMWNAGEFVKNLGSTILTALGGVWDQITAPLSAWLATFESHFGSVGDIARNTMNFIIGAVVLMVEKIRARISIIVQIFAAVFTSVGGVVSEFITRVSAQFDQLWDYITSWGRSDLTNQFAGMFSDLGDIISGQFSNIEIPTVDAQAIMGEDYLEIMANQGSAAAQSFMDSYRNLVLRYREANQGDLMPMPDVSSAGATTESRDSGDAATGGGMSGFLEGLNTGMANFRAQVKDTAAYGQRVFTTMTDGFSDALVNFAETGKLSFRDLFRSLMAEIVKMQANRLFMSLFGGIMAGGAGGAGGSFLSSLFGGGRSAGGAVRAGRAYLVGERGPEIIVPGQNGQVIPNAGNTPTQVTYNIQATDARSFREMLAAEPEFLYALTSRAARAQPR